MKKKDLKLSLQFSRRNLEAQQRENDRLKEEIRQWAEAQDSVRAEWLGIVGALGQIVPVIEGESTLTMVGRIQSLVNGHKQRMAVARNIIQDARMFDCRCIGPCNCLSTHARKFQQDAVKWLEGEVDAGPEPSALGTELEPWKKAVAEMVEAYGEMERGIEDPILCHYNGLRLHNAMEDLRVLVLPGYEPRYEPTLDDGCEDTRTDTEAGAKS